MATKKVLSIDGNDYEVALPSARIPNKGVLYFEDVFEKDAFGAKTDKVKIKGALSAPKDYAHLIPELLAIPGQQVLKLIGKTAKKGKQGEVETEKEKEG